MASKQTKTKSKSTKKTAVKVELPKFERDGKNIRRSDLIALIVFSVMVIGTGAITLMLTLGKVTVSITPKTENIPLSGKLNLVWDTQTVPADGVIATRLQDKNISVTKTFTVPEGTMAPARATGTVTLINDGSAPQALAIQTRLQYLRGEIVRTQNRVTVPTHGSVDVTVVADEAGKNGQIGDPEDMGNGTWNIPGLRQANQKLVYGKSKKALTGGEISSQQVTQNLIDAAQKEMLTSALEEEKNKAEEMLISVQSVAPANPVIALTSAVNIKTSSTPEIGASTSEYTVTLTADVQILGISKNDLADFAQKAMTNIADPSSSYQLTRTDNSQIFTGITNTNLVFKNINQDSLTISAENLDETNHLAKSNFSFIASYMPQQINTSDLRHTLTGKSESKALQVLRADPSIADAKIIFAKFFPKMMPSIPSLITVKIQQ